MTAQWQDDGIDMRRLLGLREAAVDSDYVQFDMGGGRVFELVERSGLPQYDRRRFQVGFAVDDIRDAHEQLRRKGFDADHRDHG